MKLDMGAVLTRPLADDIDKMVPVDYYSVPGEIRAHARRYATDKWWHEVAAPLSTQGGCKYGCKVYARRRGAVMEFAVRHSSIYGDHTSVIVKYPSVFTPECSE
jgi:hypothetical protein